MTQDITQSLTRSIISTLQNSNRPVSMEEISFRTRTTDSLVQNCLDQLVEAKIVVKEGSLFILNRQEKDYQLKRMLY